MKQIELVFREILYRAIEKKEFSLTQAELSRKLGISLSVINLAVKKLSNIGAIQIKQRSFNLVDIKKALYFWASIRNLQKDIIFKTRLDLPIREIERNIPNIAFTAYSAYKFRFKDVPADYSEVYAYGNEDEINLIKRRFFKNTSKNGVRPNLFILKKDDLIQNYKSVPSAQIFVDLWNLKEWYAKEFVIGFEKKINEILMEDR